MSKYVVYESALDDVPKEGYAHNGIDAEVDMCRKIAEWLGDGAKTARDSEFHDYEILVGNTARKETEKFLSKLEPNQYGISCFGSGAVVCGHCSALTVAAAEKLIEFDPSVLVDGFSRIFTDESLTVDFPRFGYGSLCGMTDCSSGRTEFVYMQTTEENIEEYASLLSKCGYREEYRHKTEQNLFCMYRNGKNFLHLTHRGATGRTAIIVGDTGRCTTVGKIPAIRAADGTVSLTQMTFDYSGGAFGMCYIITLEDGSFVIIDGGRVREKNGYPKTYDHVRLYTLLNELNRRTDGKVVISGWFMTHEHPDHFDVFYWFCREYGNRVTVKRYYHCPCTNAVAYNSKNPGAFRGRLAAAAEFAGGFETVTLMPGDRLKFGSVRFEVLYTVDELFPDRLRYFNDSSLVLSMSYKKQKTLWLGDVCTMPSKFLRTHYTAKTLKSDIVQLAHHGLNGAERELYDTAGGKVLLWSLRSKLVDGIFASEPTEEHQKLAYHLRDESGAEEIITHTRDNVTLGMPYYPGKGVPVLH